MRRKKEALWDVTVLGLLHVLRGDCELLPTGMTHFLRLSHLLLMAAEAHTSAIVTEAKKSIHAHSPMEVSMFIPFTLVLFPLEWKPWE